MSEQDGRRVPPECFSQVGSGAASSLMASQSAPYLQGRARARSSGNFEHLVGSLHALNLSTRRRPSAGATDTRRPDPPLGRARPGTIKSSSTDVKASLIARMRNASQSLKDAFHPTTLREHDDAGAGSAIIQRSASEAGPQPATTMRMPSLTFRTGQKPSQSAPRDESLSDARPRSRPQQRDPPVVSLDPYVGAAARQAARDHGRLGPKSLVRHDSNLSPARLERDRESGVSLSLASSDDEKLQHAARKDPIEYLPAELSTLILSYLDHVSLTDAERVSKRWQEAAADPHVWRSAFQRAYYPDPEMISSASSLVGGRGIGKLRKTEQDWKAMHKIRKLLEDSWKWPQARATYLHGHTDSVYCVQFDETKIITGSRDRTIRVWSVEYPYKCLRVIGVPDAFETDRKELGATYRLDIQESRSSRDIDRERAPLDPPDASIYHTPSYYHDASILCLQYDDEIAVTGSSDCTLIVWDIKTWQPVRRLRMHTAGVLDIALDKHKIISCSKDATICIWDRGTGKLVARLTGHRGPVNAVQLRGDLFVSASGEGRAKLWNLKLQNPGTAQVSATTRAVRDFWSEDRGLACVEFSEDAKYILAGGNDQVIYKFDTASGAVKSTMRGHDSLVRSLYLDSANRRIISGSYDLSVRVWDSETGEELLHLPNWATSWMLSAKSDYRRIVSTSQDGRVCVVDFGAMIKAKRSKWIDLLKNEDELLGPADQLVPLRLS